ncbi:hypothetical protein, partial [Escherichia coli]
PVFHTIVSIKNDGHYFCRAGGNRPDGLNEPVTAFLVFWGFKFLSIKFGLSAKQRPYPTITICGQLSDNMVYTEKHIRII